MLEPVLRLQRLNGMLPGEVLELRPKDGWMTHWRRLSRNYEHTTESGRAIVQVAMIGIMLRRLTKTNKR